MTTKTKPTSPPFSILPVVTRRPVFLTARWQALAMINFAVDPQLLQPLVPRGTELDFYAGKAYVSVVGFLFRQTKLLGCSVPWHIDFEEVNLRFYVRHSPGHEVRRGVCFVRELVPRRAIAAVARWCYNESFLALPMRSNVDLAAITADQQTSEQHHLAYDWKSSSGWCGLQVRTIGSKQLPAAGSLEEFIAEHYWGYCRQRDGGTIEYEVQHTPWSVWQAEQLPWLGDVPRYYGESWAQALSGQASSVFVADGSAVQVFRPTRIN
ncbi:YqjF family protein [Anatilimnocola sp. NA78]|uniref:YqjF family protein n=1 Tax=Anatilimnocola sp. NA78 TaxID=3415683 RepID=UPI003CE57E62